MTDYLETVLRRDDKVKHVCCVAHARRKFVAATDAWDQRASRAMELFGRLYAVERALPPLLPPSDASAQREQRRQRRQRDAGPVWDELSQWMTEQKPGTLPKSPNGRARAIRVVRLVQARQRALLSTLLSQVQSTITSEILP